VDLTHASTASNTSTSLLQDDSNNPNPQIFSPLNTSAPQTLQHQPVSASSPKSNSNTQPPTNTNLNSTSLSSISNQSDLLLRRPLAVKRTQQIRTLTINFRSLRNKKQELWNLITCTDPDIILGNETWLRPDITNSEILPPNFDVYRLDRSDGFGGVLVATKNNLISHQIPSPTPAEAVLVSIKTQSNSNLIVGSLYRPPSSTSEVYTASMTKVIEIACRSKKDIVWLGGDLNLPDIDWQTLSIKSNQYSKSLNQAYLDKLENVGLLQTNLEPTRGESILDVFLSNRPSLARTRLIPGLSDHDVVLSDSTIHPARTKPAPALSTSGVKQTQQR
jgi:hypothetical protein